MRWYWHVTAVTLIVGGTVVSLATGVPLYCYGAVATWYVVDYGIVRRRRK